ncbi:MAG: oligosaccharide flippase family protein [Deltaproteobacteria bacterium]|nr:oligosaccharide flippase family protein [Deltaproteobacteria bacterium]
MKNILNDSLFKNGIYIFIFSMSANFFNYLFQISMGRLLTVSEYGILNSLFSILLIISVPASTITIIAAKNISHNLAISKFNEVKKFIKRISLKVLFFGLLVLIVYLIFIPYLMDFMKINVFLYYAILGAVLLISFFFSLLIGILQGTKMYGIYGLMGSLSSAGKFVIAVVLVLLGLDIAGALLSTFIAQIAVSLIAIIFIYGYFKKIGLKQVFGENNDDISNNILTVKYFLLVIFSLFFYTFFTNIDLIMVKHFFSSKEAGIYAVSALLGKIILYLPASFAVVMFPEVSHAHALNNKTKRILFKTILITTLLCLFGEIFYILFPGFIISTLMGTKYLKASPLLSLYGLSMFSFAILSIMVNYYMAVQKYFLLFLMFLFAILEVILISLFHQTMISVIFCVMATGYILMATSLAHIFYYDVVLMFKKFYIFAKKVKYIA